MLKRLSVVLLSAAVMAACSDSTNLAPESVPAPPAGRELLAELTCSADPAAARISCVPASARMSSGALGDLIIGGQNIYVKLTSTNVVNNGTTLTGDVTVQNLTVQPWATANGTTPSAEGVRVFFHTMPSNGVTVANADGVQTYTAANQPYHAYTGSALGLDAILAAGETSTSKSWVFNLNGAGAFTFQVYVVARLPDELGVLKWTAVSPAPAQFGTFEYVQAIWGSSASDVWIGTFNGSSALQRWNGSTWTSTASAHDITGLWGTASNNVYAVGADTVTRFDGTSWSTVSDNTSNALFSIWGSSASDIYAGGAAGTVLYSPGGAFTTISSLTTGIGNESIRAIWGSSSSDVYFGANNVYRYNGTSWSTVNTGINNVGAIWGSSASDIWMGGPSGSMAHYVSGSWVTSTVGTGDITGLWGTSASDVYMVNRIGEIWHYNGSSWVSYTVPNVAFTAIWGSGRTDVWAVGADRPGFQFNRVYRGTR